MVSLPAAYPTCLLTFLPPTRPRNSTAYLLCTYVGINHNPANTYFANMAWQELAAKKRNDLHHSIPPEWHIPPALMPPESQGDVTTWPETSGWFTPEELAITGLTAVELLPKLASGQLKSIDVTKAFCKRAAAAHQIVFTPISHSRRHISGFRLSSPG